MRPASGASRGWDSFVITLPRIADHSDSVCSRAARVSSSSVPPSGSNASGIGSRSPPAPPKITPLWRAQTDHEGISSLCKCRLINRPFHSRECFGIDGTKEPCSCCRVSAILTWNLARPRCASTAKAACRGSRPAAACRAQSISISWTACGAPAWLILWWILSELGQSYIFVPSAAGVYWLPPA